MPTTSKVFIDTNVFVAFKDAKDSTHTQAKDLYQLLKSKKVKFYTSSAVIGETLTVISKKLGKEAALEFLGEVKSYIHEIFIDKFLHKETLDAFRRVRSKTVSFIDCSSAVAIKRHKIKVIFSFDKDFRKLGVRLAADVF